jgi:hypothetical protein
MRKGDNQEDVMNEGSMQNILGLRAVLAIYTWHEELVFVFTTIKLLY